MCDFIPNGWNFWAYLLLFIFLNKWFVIRVQAQTQMQHFWKWFGLIPPGSANDLTHQMTVLQIAYK